MQYDYDPITGFYVGWRNGPATATSTDIKPTMDLRRARFVAGAWIDDPAQEQAAAAATQAAETERTGRAQAVDFLRGLDFDAATQAQLRTACKAMWALIKVMHRE